MVETLIAIEIIIAAISWYAQHRWRRRVRRLAALRETAGLEVLSRRYARGEIDRNEFLQKKADILDTQSAVI